MPHHGEKREQFESQKNMINLLRAHLTPPHSAGLKPAVTPICNRQRANRPVVVELFTPRGLQIRDTAGCKPALRGQSAACAHLLMPAEWVLTGTMPWIRREFLPDRTRNAAPQTTKGFIGHPASRRSESETKKIAAV
jgi:hypothetical protein